MLLFWGFLCFLGVRVVVVVFVDVFGGVWVVFLGLCFGFFLCVYLGRGLVWGCFSFFRGVFVMF